MVSSGRYRLPINTCSLADFLLKRNSITAWLHHLPAGNYLRADWGYSTSSEGRGSGRLAGMGPQKTQLPPAIGARPAAIWAAWARRRRHIVVGGGGDAAQAEMDLILAAVLAWPTARTRHYPAQALSATSIIQVHNGASNEYRLERVLRLQRRLADQDEHGSVDPEERDAADTVAREMDLANNPDFLGAKGPVAHVRSTTPKRARERSGASSGRVAGAL
jgi:hypothetical protein